MRWGLCPVLLSFSNEFLNKIVSYWQGSHCYFKTNFSDFLSYFSWNATLFLWCSTDVVFGPGPIFYSSNFWLHKVWNCTSKWMHRTKCCRNRGKLVNFHARLKVWQTIEKLTTLKGNNSNYKASLIFPYSWKFPWFGGRPVQDTISFRRRLFFTHIPSVIVT